MMNSPTIQGFEALQVNPALCAHLATFGITAPTPIQAEAIPIARNGQDLIGIAQTGTGKTFAFGIPISETLPENKCALILAPTRELAQQIAESLERLRLKSVLVVGGAPMRPQMKLLKSRFDVIVATPGRLIDHLDQRTISLNRVSIAVLDEADRMLDMGFAPAIKRIFESLPEQRQTMLFSATMPKTILDLAQRYLKSPERIEVAREGTPAELIEHEVVVIDHEEKHDALQSLLHENCGSILVFARTRHGARKLAKAVRKEGHEAAELHSDRSLAQRREALQGFKSGQYRVLVATDIAARGIDVKDISLVINFDVPDCPDEYVHRIGRTGRAGAMGRAITLAIPAQAGVLREIERLIGESLRISDRSTITLPDRRPSRAPSKKVEKPAKGKFGRKPEGSHSPERQTKHRFVAAPKSDRFGAKPDRRYEPSAERSDSKPGQRFEQAPKNERFTSKPGRKYEGGPKNEPTTLKPERRYEASGKPERSNRDTPKNDRYSPKPLRKNEDGPKPESKFDAAPRPEKPMTKSAPTAFQRFEKKRKPSASKSHWGKSRKEAPGLGTGKPYQPKSFRKRD